ncbi:hypothetical protein SLEP1_g27083 [Rubroshorea leprosula]|uniref:Expansin-like EG45 domain-containing protein n=1 Tax=Rubroshorea leprosula TaxID=152421 RepID=A0AAV5JZ05_9ROSI|nr:hypothetical protein SLEP1_g27083 [Rubroshorea leprosula]
MNMAIALVFCILVATNALALFPQSIAVDPDVGLAARYNPPYTPTACYGNDPKQLPSGDLFGAIGERLWDNGAACGRQYQVMCISEAIPKFCVPGRTITVTVVDRAQTLESRPSSFNVSFVLSSKAYELIADPAVASIQVQFQQV